MKRKLITLFLSGFFIISAQIAKCQLINDSINVIHYDIHLNLSNVSNNTISGNTRVSIQPRIAHLSHTSLYLLHMNIDSIVFNDYFNTNFLYNDTILRIYFPVLTEPMDTLTLNVFYHGTPQIDPSGWGGFYFQNNIAYNLGVGFQTNPHSFGRAWFPCVDEFVSKSFYDTYITTSNSQTAVCGGSLLDTISLGGYTIWHWKLSNKIPAYLASVSVGNYLEVPDIYNGIHGSIPIKIYVSPSDSLKAVASFSNLKNILQIFENRFGAYRWERVGYVGVPFNGGAMEHATNITYPEGFINGDHTYESFFAHELSHHWFGDLITCETEGDMWINEGWGSFCESIFTEGLYGNDAYKSYVNANHKTVLESAHVDDNGYWALYGMPHAVTYGTTTYKKGADVLYTLRNYMGDSLFFTATKQLLDSFSFKNINTQQYQTVLSNNSGMNLHDFFDGWIYSTGLPHFSIDSITPSFPGATSDVKMFVKQKRWHTPNFAYTNKVEVTFMNAQCQKHTALLNFSGETAYQEFHLPFEPKLTVLDFDKKVSDAVIAENKVISAIGNFTFTNTYLNLIVSNITDSAFCRVEHHYVEPDPLKQPNPHIKRIHDRRYWKFDGILNSGFVAKGRFSFNKSSDFQELGLLTTANSIDSLLMLYRENAKDDWHQINFTKVGTTSGVVLVDSMRPGEYTFGIGVREYQGICDPKITQNEKLMVIPNPSNSGFEFMYESNSTGSLQVIDNVGRFVKMFDLQIGKNTFFWKPDADTNTTYHVIVKDAHQKMLTSQQAVFIK